MVGMQIDQDLTDRMIDQAILECADKLFAGDSHLLRQALLQGHCEYCHCIADSLVRQISEYLGLVDRTVKAVYHYEPISIEEGSLSDTGNNSFGINLLVWVERKSAALGALLETLESVLSASQRKIGCADASPSCLALDVKLVTDPEVQDHRGFGLLIGNTYLRSQPVWTRSGLSENVVPQREKSQEQAQLILPEAFDPELIPEGRLLEHALSIERVPEAERGSLQHHLTELKVILIRRLISDQLAYINVAKLWFNVSDLAEVYKRKIGIGKIGGKAAGMLLAENILNSIGDDELRASFYVPESYFLGSDVMYIFLAMNGLMYWNDQKYKSEEEIRGEYSQIKAEFKAGKFPPEILAELDNLLSSVGKKPLIVRSSSQLEDNFGTSFAGKYDSFFCPNQGSQLENLEALTRSIASTYASTLKPEALLYRRSKGLQDYDERMAILIQVVQGEQFGKYYFPQASGVAFSRNLYRWSPKIRREDGFARLVWGLGTRAVERVGDDYPRLVALSHPNLQPDDSTEAIRRYSQRYLDVIDLEENALTTLPVHDVLRPNYPILRYLVQLEKDGFFSTPRMRVTESDIPNLAITFDELLRRSNFASVLTKMLHLLEENYHSSVDMEFTLSIVDAQALNPKVAISLLQCRPQSHFQGVRAISLPKDLPEEEILFSTNFMVPQGYLSKIRFILFVSPEAYFALPTREARSKIGQTISKINSLLDDKTFICIGPGRWGSTNPDLGVFVSYADIHRAGALIELSGKDFKAGPEPSLGTHFFQDLMEAEIYPLAIPIGVPDARFNHDLLYKAPNSLTEWIDVDQIIADCVRLVDVGRIKPGYHVELIMDDEKGLAVAFFAADTQ